MVADCDSVPSHNEVKLADFRFAVSGNFDGSFELRSIAAFRRILRPLEIKNLPAARYADAECPAGAQIGGDGSLGALAERLHQPLFQERPRHNAAHRHGVSELRPALYKLALGARYLRACAGKAVAADDRNACGFSARGTREKFDAALRRATLWVAGSFLLSSVLNFALASYIFRSEAGTEAFNAEVGRMTALSFPVIALPTMAVLFYAMYRLFGAMGECTGLSLEEAMLKREKK